MSEISLKCEIWHRIAKIWDRQKFRILVEISAILAPHGAFSQKMSENVEKCIFSKLTEIHWFFIFSFKIDFERCLLHESLDFDNRNMDNFRQKKHHDF